MKVATKLMMFMSTESFFTSRTISGQAPVMPNGCRRTAPSFQNRGFRTSGSTPPRSWTSHGCSLTKSTGFQIWKRRRFSLLYQESNRHWICRCRSLWWRVLFALQGMRAFFGSFFTHVRGGLVMLIFFQQQRDQDFLVALFLSLHSWQQADYRGDLFFSGVVCFHAYILKKSSWISCCKVLIHVFNRVLNGLFVRFLAGSFSGSFSNSMCSAVIRAALATASRRPQRSVIHFDNHTGRSPCWQA